MLEVNVHRKRVMFSLKLINFFTFHQYNGQELVIMYKINIPLYLSSFLKQLPITVRKYDTALQLILCLLYGVLLLELLTQPVNGIFEYIVFCNFRFDCGVLLLSLPMSLSFCSNRQIIPTVSCKVSLPDKVSTKRS